MMSFNVVYHAHHLGQVCSVSLATFHSSHHVHQFFHHVIVTFRLSLQLRDVGKEVFHLSVLRKVLFKKDYLH